MTKTVICEQNGRVPIISSFKKKKKKYQLILMLTNLL